MTDETQTEIPFEPSAEQKQDAKHPRLRNFDIRVSVEISPTGQRGAKFTALDATAIPGNRVVELLSLMLEQRSFTKILEGLLDNPNREDIAYWKEKERRVKEKREAEERRAAELNEKRQNQRTNSRITTVIRDQEL